MSEEIQLKMESNLSALDPVAYRTVQRELLALLRFTTTGARSISSAKVNTELSLRDRSLVIANLRSAQ